LLLPLVKKHASVAAFFSADEETLHWVELFLHRYLKAAQLEQTLNKDPNSGAVVTATTVTDDDELSMVQQLLAVMGVGVGVGVGVGTSTSSESALKAVASLEKVANAEKALKELEEVVVSFGGALVGEEVLAAEERAAQEAAEAAAAAAGDGADVVDDSADDSSVDFGEVAPAQS